MRRVVITGIGTVTPLGNNIHSTWDSIINKKSGISLISRFNPEGLPSQIAGELKQFNPGDYVPQKDLLRLDPFVQYAAAAALMACMDSGLISLNSPHVTRHALLEKAGVIVGSSRGGISTMEQALEKNSRDMRPFSAYLMSSTTINMASSYISMRLGIKGPSLGISTACASGSNAIGEAFNMIRSERADLVLAGGTDAPICRLAIGGYGSSGSLSNRNKDPEKASRPFDSERDGFVISEGSGILVLEELGCALKRDAVIYAEIIGYGSSSDAFHQTQPDSEGEAMAISNALKDAGIRINEVDYINAHATSTPLGDAAESRAIKKVFGKLTSEIYVSSCKSMLGHMIGAAGAVEAAITALSIYKGTITPTNNLDNLDPECDLNIATQPVNQDINTAISNSFGFGGVNAVLVLMKFK
jgi:3-oxoacyl-[acyl-carrier-protein] synthase II